MSHVLCLTMLFDESSALLAAMLTTAQLDCWYFDHAVILAEDDLRTTVSYGQFATT